MCWTTCNSFPSWEIFIVKKVEKKSNGERRLSMTFRNLKKPPQGKRAAAKQFNFIIIKPIFDFHSYLFNPTLLSPFGFKLKPNANNEWRGVELSTSTKRDSYWDFTTQHKQYRMYLRVAQEKKKLHLVAIQSRSTFFRLRLLLFRVGSSSHCFSFFGCTFMFSICCCCSSVSSTMYV